MSEIITVTRLMSSLGIKPHWVKKKSIFDIFTSKQGKGEIAGIIISLQNNPSFKNDDG